MNGIKSYVSYNDMHTHKHADVLAHMQKKVKIIVWSKQMSVLPIITMDSQA